MQPDHLFGRFVYMNNDIPKAGKGPPGGHVPLRHRSGDRRC